MGLVLLMKRTKPLLLPHQSLFLRLLRWPKCAAAHHVEISVASLNTYYGNAETPAGLAEIHSCRCGFRRRQVNPSDPTGDVA